MIATHGLSLHKTPKVLQGAIPRAVAPEETCASLRALMPQAGITHLLDLTGLDLLGLPVYLAFGPMAADFELSRFVQREMPEAGPLVDRLGEAFETFAGGNGSASGEKGERPLRTQRMVFAAGKGVTALDAKVSAMMESLERLSARQPSEEPQRASLREMQLRGEPLLDPRRLILLDGSRFSEDQPLEWSQAFDLTHDRPVWAPADAGTFAYTCAGRVCSDTPTGLGAGNTLEEAVSHGLAEAIEHDAWSLALARRLLSGAEAGLVRSLFGEFAGQAPASGPQVSQMGSLTAGDAQIAPPFQRVDLDSIRSVPVVGDLVAQVESAGAQIVIYAIPSDVPVPVFAVSVSGLAGGEDGGGLGAHPDARLALARAITEAAQQRLLLGMHSLARLASPARAWKKLDWESTLAGEGGRPCDFAATPSVTHLDILDDIHCMLAALKSSGYEQVVVADLRKPDLNIPVVKVIVPGLSDYWTSSAPPDWTASLNRIRKFMYNCSIGSQSALSVS